MDQLPFRVQRIFNGLFSPQDNYQQEEQPPLNSTPINDMSIQPSPDMIIKGLMTGQNTAGDRLNEMLNQQPMHDDFKPSFGRKLAGGLMNITDPGMARSFVDRPYNNAMQDWSGKLKPLGELADSEKAQNSNNRLIGSYMLRDKQATDRVDATKRGQDIAAETADKNREQKNAFKAYLEHKALNPGDKWAEDKSGFVYFWNPVTHAITYAKDPVTGDPIEGNKMPENTKMDKVQEDELAKIEARGNESRKTVGAQQGKEIAVENAKQPNRIATKTATPGKNTSVVDKPKIETVAVISPDGTPGSIPKGQLAAAKAQGYKEANVSPAKTTGVGLNLKPLVPQTRF